MHHHGTLWGARGRWDRRCHIWAPVVQAYWLPVHSSMRQTRSAATVVSTPGQQTCWTDVTGCYTLSSQTRPLRPVCWRLAVRVGTHLICSVPIHRKTFSPPRPWMRTRRPAVVRRASRNLVAYEIAPKSGRQGGVPSRREDTLRSQARGSPLPRDSPQGSRSQSPPSLLNRRRPLRPTSLARGGLLALVPSLALGSGRDVRPRL